MSSDLDQLTQDLTTMGDRQTVEESKIAAIAALVADLRTEVDQLRASSPNLQPALAAASAIINRMDGVIASETAIVPDQAPTPAPAPEPAPAEPASPPDQTAPTA